MASGTFKKVGQDMGRMQSLGKTAAANLTTNLTRIGLVGGGFLASQVAFGIRSLEDLERVTNATAGVIESTGGKAGVTAGEVAELSSAMEDLTTADDKSIQAGQNLLLTFTGIGKDVFPGATKAMTDMAIAMAGGDVETANFDAAAIQLGKALNDPIKGVTALSKVGVSFTKQQKKQIKTLVEAGKVQEAQAIILRELEVEFGKAGEAAGKGFGADMRRFHDAAEGAQQALARGLIPVIQRVSQFLERALADPDTLRQIEDVGKGLADAFEDGLEAAKRIPWAQIGDAMRFAGTGAKAALDFFTGLPPWIQTAVLTGWGLNKLTGGALPGIVGTLASGFIKGVLGITAGIVHVKGPVAGGPVGGGGKGGPPGVVAGGAGKLMTGLGVASAALSLIGLAATWQEVNESSSETARGVRQLGKDFVSQNSLTREQLTTAIGGVDKGIQDLESNPLSVLVRGDALEQLKATRQDLLGQLRAQEAREAAIALRANEKAAAAVTAINQTRSAIERKRTTFAVNIKNTLSVSGVATKTFVYGSIVNGPGHSGI